MQILGIVGGIACGKSVVSAALKELGAAVLDADGAAHQVLQHPEVRQILVTRWGPEILDKEGEVSRKAVASHVFSNARESSAGNRADRERRFLEQIIHPRVRQQFQQEIDLLDKQGVEVAVIDAPLLLEAGWATICDTILFVDCPRETRLERALKRGWSKEQFLEREAAQWPIEKKQQTATLRLDNSGQSMKPLVESVRQLWNRNWASGRQPTTTD